MKRVTCKSCGKIIGYEKDTGRSHYDIKEVEITYTHARYEQYVAFPNAKEDKYKYGKRLTCEYCGKEAN